MVAGGVRPRDGLHRQLTTALLDTFALNLASQASMLGLTVLLARYMGAHEYGIYASALREGICRYLDDIYGGEIRLLEELTGQYLSAWCSRRGRQNIDTGHSEFRAMLDKCAPGN